MLEVMSNEAVCVYVCKSLTSFSIPNPCYFIRTIYFPQVPPQEPRSEPVRHPCRRRMPHLSSNLKHPSKVSHLYLGDSTLHQS